jgi:hypothetical protein
MSQKGNPIQSFLHFFDDFGLNSVWILVVFGFGMIVFALSVIPIPASRWLGIAFATSPLWLPYVLFFIFFKKWLGYVQLHFWLAQGRTTLELQFPQEIFKSPLAMEMVLTQMYQTASPDNHIQTYWDGKHPPTYGLEIVSDGGRVSFYINTPAKKFKNMWETHLYAQYPGIIVRELPVDYTAAVPWDPKRFLYFSIHYMLKKPDAYPIKTYIDYGLDQDPKEEFKIDPLAPVIETLGSIGLGEKMWIQILISAHRKEDFKVGSLTAKSDWKEAVQKEIDGIAQRDTKTKKGAAETEMAPRVTPKEKDTLIALERSLSKYAFNTKIRTMYIAESDKALPGERIGPMVGFWRHLDDITRNSIGLIWRTDVNWPLWQDRSGKQRLHMKQEELHEYKLREYEEKTPTDHGFIMTTEELATLFRPVGQTVTTPTLERVSSARSEPPANLPRGNV